MSIIRRPFNSATKIPSQLILPGFSPWLLDLSTKRQFRFLETTVLTCILISFSNNSKSTSTHCIPRSNTSTHPVSVDLHHQSTSVSPSIKDLHSSSHKFPFSMPPSKASLTITNPLVLYRSLVATNRIQPDPAQHRLGDVDHIQHAKHPVN